MYRRILPYIPATLFCVFALAMLPTASAQGAGQLSGTVADSGGAIIPGATVTVTHILSKQSRAFETLPNGSFVFPGLLTGAYNLRGGKDWILNLRAERHRDCLAGERGPARDPPYGRSTGYVGDGRSAVGPHPDGLVRPHLPHRGGDGGGPAQPGSIVSRPGALYQGPNRPARRMAAQSTAGRPDG